MRLTDEQGERQFAFLAKQTDAAAIVYLLTLDKLAAHHAERVDGPLYFILEAQAAALYQVLDRVAPETFADALALWFEKTDDGEFELPVDFN